MKHMRRASAILLLALLSLAVAMPMVLADPESQLPACCRRDGKHHCAMMAMADSEEPSDPVLAAVRATCSYFPNVGAVASHPNTIAPEISPDIFTAIISHPAIQAQLEAHHRISFSRTHPKRGPPIRLS
jgi:hypothetical protein